jgi:ATP-dependent Lon protease
LTPHQQREVRRLIARFRGLASLRGLVLPVGGVKEKVIAAQRTGIKRVMLPARNRRDLEDIPGERRRQLEFIWLEHVEDAVAAGLENAQEPLRYSPPSSPAHLAELIA